MVKDLIESIRMIIVVTTLVLFGVETQSVTSPMYESSNGVSVGGSGIGGVQGKISITSPKINATGLSGHRDYMLYIRVQDSRAAQDGTIGAGWIAWKDSNNITRKASLVYVNDDRYRAAVHNIKTSVSSLSTIDVTVTQNSRSKNCWRASTYGQIYNWCFDTSLTKPFAAARRIKRVLYAEC